MAGVKEAGGFGDVSDDEGFISEGVDFELAGEIFGKGFFVWAEWDFLERVSFVVSERRDFGGGLIVCDASGEEGDERDSASEGEEAGGEWLCGERRGDGSSVKLVRDLNEEKAGKGEVKEADALVGKVG